MRDAREVVQSYMDKVLARIGRSLKRNEWELERWEDIEKWKAIGRFTFDNPGVTMEFHGREVNDSKPEAGNSSGTGTPGSNHIEGRSL